MRVNIHSIALKTTKFLACCLGLMLLFISSSFAQTFGNEWIVPGQQYFKFPVYETAIYRLSYNDLQKAGVAVASIDPRNLQMFYKGREIAIVIQGEADGVFHTGDYIEFYGVATQSSDQVLFDKPTSNPNPYLNLYGRVSQYFLTYGNSRGKRMEVVNPGTAQMQAELSAEQEIILPDNDIGVPGAVYPTSFITDQDKGAILSGYTEGKGVIGARYLPYSGKVVSSIQLTDAKPGLNKVKIEMRLVGRVNTIHDVDLFVGTNADSLTKRVANVRFSFYQVRSLAATLDSMRFSSKNPTLYYAFRVNRVNNDHEMIATAYTRIIYEQGFDMQRNGSRTFILNPNPNGISKVEVTNVLPNTQFFDYTDETNVKLLTPLINGTTYTLSVPNSHQPRKIYAFANYNGISVEQNSAVTFKALLPASYDYVILSHKKLMKEAGGFSNAVEAYAAYRASAAGGNYKTAVVDVEDLYNHFSYGEPTPLAIRRFCEYMVRTNRPRFLFIIGKGLSMLSFYYATLPWSLNWAQQSFVPPFGHPGSDNEYSAGLGGMPAYIPAIPTGRLSAYTPEHVINYLNKVKEHEAASGTEEWRKNILHLSGGKSITENGSFRRYMDGFKAIAEGDFLGANVSTTSKKTTEAVEYINIRDELNKGNAMVTFFGHSSANYTDIEIGRASDDRNGYRNKGKYPMLFMNGCQSGDIFSASMSVGEDWVVTANRGALLFFAHGHFGFEHTLRAYAQNFYQTAFSDRSMLNRPIGMVVQEAGRRFLNLYGQDALSIANVQQAILQGDPAIVLFRMSLPDYQITDNSLFAQPIGTTRLDAQADSFRIGIGVTNLGITDRTPIGVSVRRTYNDGSVEILPLHTFPHVRNRDTLYFTVVNEKDKKDKVYGINRFQVFVDAEGKVAENREDNNMATLTVFSPKSTMVALSPREYSIVSRQPVRLIAQNTDAFTKERSYEFELDTAYLFNSAAKKKTIVTGYVTPQWITPLLTDNAKDSTVYYWRVRYHDRTAEDDTTWVNSTFVYIKDSPAGWSQSAIPQFDKAVASGIAKDMNKRSWNFNSAVSRLKIKAVGGYAKNRDDFYININDNFTAGQSTCFDNNFGDNVLILVTIDGETGQIKNTFAGTDESYGNNSCGTSLLASIINSSDAVSKALLARYLEGTAQGDYVIMINGHFVSYQYFSTRELNALGSVGVDINQLQKRLPEHSPYILIGRKGTLPGTAIERFPDPSKGDPTQQEVTYEGVINHSPYSGRITSSLIGPARQWGNVFRKFEDKNANASDSWNLNLIGVNYQGEETLLMQDVRRDGLDISAIDARTYPYLRLQAIIRDSLKRTPYQLQKWQVIYQEVPEGLLTYDTTSYKTNSLLQVFEGDSAKIRFNFINISGTDFYPNLPVQYLVANTDGMRGTFYDTLRTPVKAGEVRNFTAKVNSLDFRGENKVTAIVNPRIQPEQIYENNILEARFKVVPDNVNPVLDVAFDGRHIMNGDIVASTPLITVTLRDENKYLIMRDTTGMELLLRKCDSCSFKRINLNDPGLTWTSSGANNKLSVEYRPEKLDNGTYTLLVQGTDVTGNASGIEPYQVSFRVINENTITNFYPYPNPFSTSMRFVFTLTGEIPDDIRIQIMTISGKVVRVIHREELGTLRIGTNLSEFAWDGTDEYGDKLANGVYLYKVDVRSNSKNYEHSSTAADNLFKHGYGKIYLLR